MRKTRILVLLLLIPAVLAGCRSAGSEERQLRDAWDEALEETGDWADAWDEAWSGLEDAEYGTKTHYWQVLDGEGRELYRIDDEDRTAAVDGLLQDGDGWKLAEETRDAPLYTYVFWQEKTLLAGQDPQEERMYEDILQVSVYEEGSTVCLRVMPDMPEVPAVDLAQLLPRRGLLPAPPASFPANRENRKNLRKPGTFS